MAKGYTKLTQMIYDLINDKVEELGYFIWDIEYVKEGSEKYLIITIDSVNGIDIEDCEKVHRAVNPIIDEKDPIAEAYYLNISSPGLERTIRTRDHFILCDGDVISIKLFAPKNGRKAYVGIMSFDDTNSNISIDENGTVTTFNINEIAKANTVYNYSNEDYSADFGSEDE